MFASIDGAEPVQVATADAYGAWSFTPVLADGDRSITVTETDLAGNSASASLDFTLDTVAPPLSLALAHDTGSLATDRITADANLTGQTLPGQAVQISIDGGPAVTILANGSGAWSYAPMLADGPHQVVAIAADLAGNSTTQSFGLTLDRVATLSLGGVAYGTANNALTGYTVSGLAEAGSLVRLSQGATLLGSTTALADGSWSVAVTPIVTANFRSVLSIASTDLAGNAAPAVSLGLIVDRVNPTVLAATSAHAGIPNLILGLGGLDSLQGSTGQDTLDGGSGADTMAGGDGNDTYIADSSLDLVTELTGQGIDTVLASAVSFSLAANVEHLAYTGAGSFAGTGNALANRITGGAGADTLAGGANASGVDTLVGGGGNDTYIVANAGDVILEAMGGGTDTIRTALGSYTLGANLENLTHLGASPFQGLGNGLANIITGGNGDDTLDGGTGADTMAGGAGDDTYMVDSLGDVLSEGAGQGTDLVIASVAFTLGNGLEHLTLTGSADLAGTGNTSSNQITGNGGANLLSGGQGVDTLSGGLGNDTLDGGSGNDSLLGGGGDDTYLASGSGEGHRRICRRRHRPRAVLRAELHPGSRGGEPDADRRATRQWRRQRTGEHRHRQ